ncbi:hypothetical protein MC7420_5013 [Coleofasciculus chthonoplastes PCC 7420]|uniref:Uncharacterized protein n=1 Tax=Coleofasciculus chthonoplastes PCC 7420 TaxID=118168 RepID=B4VZJ0_9CYAN|nr:hypothetical protein MC7420_5013 [Coleofasciculus chthonoplastes PCC 7420]
MARLGGFSHIWVQPEKIVVKPAPTEASHTVKIPTLSPD